MILSDLQDTTAVEPSAISQQMRASLIESLPKFTLVRLFTLYLSILITITIIFLSILITIAILTLTVMTTLCGGEVCERRIQASLLFMTLNKLSRLEKLRVKRTRYILTLECLLTPSS